jgi:hypothetical protein
VQSNSESCPSHESCPIAVASGSLRRAGEEFAGSQAVLEGSVAPNELTTDVVGSDAASFTAAGGNDDDDGVTHSRGDRFVVLATAASATQKLSIVE